MNGCEMGFWRHEPVADQEALGLAQATLRFYEAVGGGWVKLTPAGTFQATSLGLVDEWAGDSLGRRRIVHRPVSSAADWAALASRAAQTGLGAQECVSANAASWLKARLPVQVPLLATVFSTLTQAVQLAGAEQVAACAEAEPDVLAACLQALGQRNLALVQALGEAGVDGVYYVSQHHEAHLWQQDMSRWLGWHFDAPAMAACPSRGWNVLHFHGRCDQGQLPAFPLVPAVATGWSVHGEGGVGADGSLGVGWLTFGPEVLACATDEASRMAVLHQAMAGRWGGRWRLGADCVLPLGFDLGQARRWVEAVHALPSALPRAGGG